ncbi:MAG TPA: hypothetical protein VMD02_03195, partial [Candidatus Omnitrophota bacterium]|nr:hypothetical protein [Candidatus Omnitrophota bacterium]
HAGAEWSPITLIKLRAGVDQKPSAGSSITNLAAGLGVNFKGFTFDYAYHTYAELSEFATHYFSIGYSPELVKKEVKPVSTTAPSQPTPVVQPPLRMIQQTTPIKAKTVVKTTTVKTKNK